MKAKRTGLIAAGLCFAALSNVASPIRFLPERLASSRYDDTEVSSNVAFVCSSAETREFRLHIDLMGNATNTVQVAFGIDDDGNGILDWRETEFLLGWRCGGWFFRDKVTSSEKYVAMPSGVRALEWKLKLDSARRAKALSVWDGTCEIDFDATDGMFNPDWNLAKITIRGGETAETIVGILTRPGILISVR